jgi:uncharacterized protein
VAGRILDNSVIPAFRQGDFSGGLREGSRAILAYVVKEKGLDLADFDLPETLIRSSGPDSNGFVGIVFPLLFILIVVLSNFRRVRRTGGGSVFRSGGFGSGGSFGRSGGSSFRGFGGGGFGGGGASRRF